MAGCACIGAGLSALCCSELPSCVTADAGESSVAGLAVCWGALKMPAASGSAATVRPPRSTTRGAKMSLRALVSELISVTCAKGAPVEKRWCGALVPTNSQSPARCVLPSANPQQARTMRIASRRMDSLASTRLHEREGCAISRQNLCCLCHPYSCHPSDRAHALNDLQRPAAMIYGDAWSACVEVAQ